jgi:Zn-dependent protease with chaperone function
MDDALEAKCSCQQCGNHISFPIEAGGELVDCPHCGQKTLLNLEAAESATASDKPSASELLKAFGPPVARTPVSLHYQLGLVLVTGLMVLLPLIYLALVGGVGYGIFYYIKRFGHLITSTTGGGRSYVANAITFLVPLPFALGLLFFLVKPLFAKRGPHAQPLALNPAVEHTLYAFIAKVCDTIRAPMPQAIYLNCELNAAAGFRRGMLSLFSNDLVLVIGLPLVAGLNLQQFAGIMAHEFGHFTQGFGMRLSYVIRVVNDWFERVGYEKDALDVWLAERAERTDAPWDMLFAGCMQFGIWIARQPLRLLMLIGQVASCFLMRQMEHDADSYEIKLAGSAASEAATRRFLFLRAALEKSYKEMRVTWNNSRRVPDNFSTYLIHQETTLPPHVRLKIENTIGFTKTKTFATHPSDTDRIRMAREANEPGIFHSELPATILFSNFEAAAKQMSLLHYNEDIGLNCDHSNLRPVTAPASAQTV